MTPSEVRAPDDTHGAFVGTPSVLAVGRPGGVLAGTRLAVKDLYAVEGVVTGAGNPTFAEGRAPSPSHAPAVARLVDAGATLIGMTVTDELAFSLSGTNVHFGTPVNPAAPDCVPGGSSAGSAVAVAAGLADLALGTDTAGSVRVPASYCAVFGWRSTHGSIPLDGVVPLAPSFDTVGLFARDPDLLHAAAAALLVSDDAGGATAQGARDNSLPDVYWFTEALDVVDADVAAAVRLALDGLEVGEIRVGIDLDEALAAKRARQLHEAWACHGDWIRAARPRFGPGVAARFDAASTVTADEAAAADPIRDRVRSRVMEVFDQLGPSGVLALPAAAGGPAPVDGGSDRAVHEARRTSTLRLTCVPGLVGAPVVVAPLASVGGLPLGVAFIGRPGSDLSLLASVGAIGRRLSTTRSS